MAVVYFGHCNSDGTPKAAETPASLSSGWGSYLLRNDPADYPFTCPGSGTYNVVSLQAYSLGASGNCRMAVYSSAGTTKVGEHNAEYAMSSASVGWFPAGTPALSPATPQLVGGTSYILVWTCDSNTPEPYGWTDWGATYGASQSGYDYTGGFPASLPSMSAYDYIPTLRCGVEAVPPSCALSGTATASITETDVITGGKTIILTLTDDTWYPS